MKKLFLKKKQRLIRYLLGFFSFSTALFVFQACYGTPEDFGNDIQIEGKILNENNEGIQGIRVFPNNSGTSDITQPDGSFILFTNFADSIKVSCEDYNPDEDGNYLPKDTTLTFSAPGDTAYIEIILKEQ